MTATIYNLDGDIVGTASLAVNHLIEVTYRVPIALGWTPGQVKTWQDSDTEYRLQGEGLLGIVRVVVS
jgi:hypothetical protein